MNKQPDKLSTGCGCYIFLLTWGILGLLLIFAWNATSIWGQVGLSIAFLVVGTFMLSGTIPILIVGARRTNPISYAGAFLFSLTEVIFLLQHKVADSTVGAVVFISIGTISLLAGIALMIWGGIAIKSRLSFFGASQLPHLTETELGEPSPLPIKWRFLGSLKAGIEKELRGFLLIPLALWPWSYFIVSFFVEKSASLSISLWVALIISAVYFGFLSAIVFFDNRSGYALLSLDLIRDGNDAIHKLPMKDTAKTKEEKDALLAPVRDEYFLPAAKGLWESLKQKWIDVLLPWNDNTRAYNMGGLAHALRYLKKFDDAFTFAKEASKLNPRDTEILFTLALCSIELSDYSAAIEAFEKSLTLTKNPEELRKLESWIEDTKKWMAEESNTAMPNGKLFSPDIHVDDVSAMWEKRLQADFSISAGMPWIFPKKARRGIVAIEIMPNPKLGSLQAKSQINKIAAFYYPGLSPRSESDWIQFAVVPKEGGICEHSPDWEKSNIYEYCARYVSHSGILGPVSLSHYAKRED